MSEQTWEFSINETDVVVRLLDQQHKSHGGIFYPYIRFVSKQALNIEAGIWVVTAYHYPERFAEPARLVWLVGPDGIAGLSQYQLGLSPLCPELVRYYISELWPTSNLASGNLP
jgi:hypothetical protein